MEYTLVVNTENCVGCHACEIACKQEHNLPVGPRLIRIIADEPRQIDGKLQLRYKAGCCIQCSQPPCLDVCPVKAIVKRPDGITIIDDKLCNGCKKCIDGCPYGVMQFDEVSKLARKCNLCVERLDRGLQPACVTVCPSHCIYVGDRKKIIQKLGREKQQV